MMLTSVSGPTIWEGRTVDGSHIWINYDRGELQAWIGGLHESKFEMMLRLPDLEIRTIDVLRRWISFDEIKDRTSELIDWSMFTNLRTVKGA